MKKVKVVLWFPNPAKLPSVSTPMRFTKRGSVFTRLRIGDYMDLTKRLKRLVSTTTLGDIN